MRKTTFVLGVAATALFLAGPAFARPATFSYNGSICDPDIPTINHELGNPPGPAGGPGFPPDQAIASSSVEVDQQVCPVPFAGPGPDYRVSITNLTGKSWVDLWFVSDLVDGIGGIPFGNVDGFMGDTTPDGAPGDPIGQSFAFRIDNVGINTPLLSEDLIADLIFQPGETWEFIVQDWNFPGFLGIGAPHLMGSIGFAGRSPGLPSADGSNASIVAREFADVIPAPASLTLLGVGLAGLGFARRLRRKD